MNEENLNENEEKVEELAQETNIKEIPPMDGQEVESSASDETDDFDDDEFDENNFVTLTDEDGNDAEFKFLDIVEVEGKEYVILLPVDKEEDGEVVIFRIEPGESEDDDAYFGVNDVQEAQKVFNVFKNQAQDRFNFDE